MIFRIAAFAAGFLLACIPFNPLSAATLCISSQAGGEAALAGAPTDPAGYLAYAEWLDRSGDLPGAVGVLEAGRRRALPSPSLLLALGSNYLRQGQLARAESIVREVLVLDPDLPEVHVRLGEIYLKSGWPQSAIESFEAAVAMSPGTTGAQARLISALLESNLATAAEDRCLQFIAEAPDEPDLWLALGLVFEKQEKMREAFTTYGQVLGLDANNAEAYARQGRLFCRYGQYTSAVESCRKSLQLDAANLTAHAYLGIASSFLGDKEQARHHARIAEAGGLNMSAVLSLPGYER